MNFELILAVLLVVSFLAEGQAYRYGTKKLTRKILRERCPPPVNCKIESIPLKCRKATFYLKDGVKCRGCDKNICPDEVAIFSPKGEKKNVKILKGSHANVEPKPVKVVEVPVPVEVPVRVNVPVPVPVSESLPTASVGPVNVPPAGFDNPSSWNARPNHQTGPLDFPPLNSPNPGILNTRQIGQIRDPLQALNSPPSDSDFVNRLRFDQNNINLLQPQVDETLNQFSNQNPLQPNLQPPFTNQANSLFPQGAFDPTLQNGGPSRDMLMLQNQQLMAQLQGQQAMLQQLQNQQTFGQFQSQQGQQLQGSALPNFGMSQDIQGFPVWGQNPNPFMNVLQQTPVPNFNAATTGFTGNGQQNAASFLNQIPPVPGLFQGQGNPSGNNWGGVQGFANPGQGLVPGLNVNFQGQGNPAGNNWGGVQGFANPGQGSVPLIDPITIQALGGSSNSLHGPINNK